MIWHVLDTASIWLKEFASPLSRLVPTQCWVPQIRNLAWPDYQRQVDLADPKLQTFEFPLQRGYSRFPLAQTGICARSMANRLIRKTADPERSVLICTSPFYAPVAERWPGRVVYYLTDMTGKYYGIDAAQVLQLDKRMCKVASLVCPNSQRIADYLRDNAGCDPRRLMIVSNATRAQNVMAEPLVRPAPLPEDLRDLPRPVVGAIGNLAANLDWVLIRDLIRLSPDFSFAFVGPSEMAIADKEQTIARSQVLQMGGRVRFTGLKPYGLLRDYGRSFDVALLPYRRQEPTFSGSPTRFYEHLAACRPILATRGMEELHRKEPLVKLVDTASEAANALEQLKSQDFRDGYEELRWNVSHVETWETRASAIVGALDPALLPHSGMSAHPGHVRSLGLAR
jgi:hypothetical protein